MYTIRKSKVNLFYFILLIFGLLGCQGKEYKKLDNLVNVSQVNNYNYTVIKYGESPVLIIGGEITSKQSLKNIYTGLDSDYARIDCDLNHGIKPIGILNIKEEVKKNNLFYYEFDMDFCPKKDPNKLSCIRDKQELAKKINKDISCKVFFGGMTKPKILISNQFEINSEQMLNSKKYFSE